MFMPEKIKNPKGDYRKVVLAALKALSNDNRLAIFEHIRAGHGKGRLDDESRLSVCDVASNFSMALSTISHHMKELRGAGLITCERDGQTVH
jgi:DNA-binding transcriptional ArsR family regulator